MVAWRYNVADNDFEIAPYYNVDLARILPNEQTEVIKVPIGESLHFTVDYSGITLTYGSTTVFKLIPADLPTNQLTPFRVQPWFGGTSLPPNTSPAAERSSQWWSPPVRPARKIAATPLWLVMSLSDCASGCSLGEFTRRLWSPMHPPMRHCDVILWQPTVFDYRETMRGISSRRRIDSRVGASKCGRWRTSLQSSTLMLYLYVVK